MASAKLYLGKYRVVFSLAGGGAPGNESISLARAEAPVFFDTVVAALKKFQTPLTNYFAEQCFAANAFASVMLTNVGITPGPTSTFQSVFLDDAVNPTVLSFAFYYPANAFHNIAIQAAYSPLS